MWNADTENAKKGNDVQFETRWIPVVQAPTGVAMSAPTAFSNATCACTGGNPVREKRGRGTKPNESRGKDR